MFPSSAFWAEMTLVMSLSREMNQRRRKMLRMSKTESSAFPEGDRLRSTPPFLAARSVLREANGGEMDMGMACWAGERMFSTSEGEDMGVKGKEGWTNPCLIVDIATLIEIS